MDSNVPLATVIVPLRDSGKHVNTLLRSLLSQDYPFFEVVLVGSPGDYTWASIAPKFKADPRLRTAEAPVPVNHVGRDSNIKRNFGASLAHGDVLFFTDAKITHEADWISYGVQLMQTRRVQAVAGIMVAPAGESHARNQWERFLEIYTDGALIRRNPEFGEGYYLTRDNFASGESLPITACWAMTRSAFEVMNGFDESFTISYEDYSGAWRFCRKGGVFYCTSTWQVYHKHRLEFRGMQLEFQRSARGAAQLAYVYPDCPFARKRIVQSLGVLATAIVALSVVLWAMFTVNVAVLGTLLTLAFTGLTSLGVLNARKAGHWYGFFFPPFTAYFILVFAMNFAHQYFVRSGGGKYLQTMWQLLLRNLP